MQKIEYLTILENEFDAQAVNVINHFSKHLYSVELYANRTEHLHLFNLTLSPLPKLLNLDLGLDFSTDNVSSNFVEGFVNDFLSHCPRLNVLDLLIEAPGLDITIDLGPLKELQYLGIGAQMRELSFKNHEHLQLSDLSLIGNYNKSFLEYHLQNGVLENLYLDLKTERHLGQNRDLYKNLSCLVSISLYNLHSNLKALGYLLMEGVTVSFTHDDSMETVDLHLHDGVLSCSCFFRCCFLARVLPIMLPKSPNEIIFSVKSAKHLLTPNQLQKLNDWGAKDILIRFRQNENEFWLE